MYLPEGDSKSCRRSFAKCQMPNCSSCSLHTGAGLSSDLCEMIYENNLSDNSQKKKYYTPNHQHIALADVDKTGLPNACRVAA